MNPSFSTESLFSLLAQPTAPFRETHVVNWVKDFLETEGVEYFRDRIGNFIIGVGSEREYRALLNKKDPEPLRILMAHMDHPGFHGVEWLDSATADNATADNATADNATADNATADNATVESPRLKVKWFGGTPTAHLEGAAVWLADEDGFWGEAHILETTMVPTGRAAQDSVIQVTRRVRAGRDAVEANKLFGAFSFRSMVWQEEETIYTKAADDLVGSFAILSVMKNLVGKNAKKENRKSVAPFVGILTRAEEVGFIGAIGHFQLGWYEKAKRRVLLVSLETSRTLPGALIGAGPVVRLGDRTGVFSASELKVFWEVAKRVLPDRHQRRVMDGGSCEATAAIVYGLPTVGVSVPLGNYHNQSLEGGPDAAPENGPAPEFVHLRDIEGLILLCQGLMAKGLPWNDPWATMREGFAAEFKKCEGLLGLKKEKKKKTSHVKPKTTKQKRMPKA